MTAALPLVLYLTCYAALHSLLASWPVKQAARRLFGEDLRAYRLTYVATSLLLLLPIVRVPLPDGRLYNLSGPVAWGFIVVQAVAAIGFIQACRMIDLKEFLGFTQLRSASRSCDLPLDENPDLVVTGLYRRCRHPLYFFGTLFLAASPHVSIGWAVVTLWCAIYFWVGSCFEERRLKDLFGEEYASYARRTPRFLPIGPRSKGDVSSHLSAERQNHRKSG